MSADNNDIINKMPQWKREQYLEIYKIQSGVITETSTRRVNVNRYYIFALSITVLAMSAVLGGASDIIPILSRSNGDIDPIFTKRYIGLMISAIGILGALLSHTWISNISGYLTASSIRYNIIKDIEHYLVFKFNKRVSKSNKDKNGELRDYSDLAFHELYAPFIFEFFFAFLIILGAWQIFSNKIAIFVILALLVLIPIVFVLLSTLIKRSIKQHE
ncbi:MAG: hypothetical protein OXI67_09925 [Candidatus Poribacteria bacterium]|nr:hypothetical protein [Candidatus Poribacteria bacterium]